MRDYRYCVECGDRLSRHAFNGHIRRCEDCREHAAEDRSVRNARILELHAKGTMTMREIATAVGCPKHVVGHEVLKKRRRATSPPERFTDAGPRCPRCLLTLPHICMAPVYAVAQRRRGDYANG